MHLLGGRVVRADPHARAVPHLWRPLHLFLLEDRFYQRRSGASEVTLQPQSVLKILCRESHAGWWIEIYYLTLTLQQSRSSSTCHPGSQFYMLGRIPGFDFPLRVPSPCPN